MARGCQRVSPSRKQTPKAFLKHLRALGLQLWHFDLFLTTKGRRVGRLASPERKVPPIRFCKKLDLPPQARRVAPFRPVEVTLVPESPYV